MQARRVHLVGERLDPAREAQRVRLKRAIGAALVGLPAVVDANVRVADVAQPGLHDRVCDGEDEVLRDVAAEGVPGVKTHHRSGMQGWVGLAGSVREGGRLGGGLGRAGRPDHKDFFGNVGQRRGDAAVENAPHHRQQHEDHRHPHAEARTTAASRGRRSLELPVPRRRRLRRFGAREFARRTLESRRCRRPVQLLVLSRRAHLRAESETRAGSGVAPPSASQMSAP